MALQPQVVDVALSLLNTLPPKHAGPIGRVVSLINAQVKQFLPSTTTGGTAQPQRILVEPREAFHSLPTELRDSSTGAIASGSWSDPELLATLGDQLLSICGSIPRVDNGASWTYYGASRVVTNRLSQDVLHTTNHVLAASDEAYAGGVTCSVWTEESAVGPIQLRTTFVGFRSDDGAWVRTSTQLYQNNAGPALARVVSDGTYFWVFYNLPTKIGVNVYDTHGVLISSDTSSINLVWTPSPGYWDVAAFNNSGSHYVLVVQPDGYSSTGLDVDIRFSKCTISGSSITITTASAGGLTSDCNGPCGFMDSTATGLPTVASSATGNVLWATEFSHALTETHAYNYGAVLAGSGIPDSLTGWMEANGSGAIAHVAYSLLSNFSPPAGPPNDPGLRYTRSYACTHAGAVTRTTQANGVLLQSRAFPIDDDWYGVTYYQGGAGNLSAPAPITIATDDTDDYFTGDVHQPVSVGSGDFTTGAPVDMVPLSTYAVLVPTQAIGSIAHNVADSAVAATRTWTLTNATFTLDPNFGSSAVGGLLHISGSAIAANNGDWYIVSVVSPTKVVTDPISLQGTGMADDTLAGVTASLVQTWPVVIPQAPAFPVGLDTPYPDPTMMAKFIGGTMVIAGAAGAITDINGSYSVAKVIPATGWRGWGVTGNPDMATSNVFVLSKTSGAAGTAGTQYVFSPGVTAILTPLQANDWALFGLAAGHDTRAGVDLQLVVTGANQPGNNGPFLETSIVGQYGRFGSVTAGQAAQRAESFTGISGTPFAHPTVSRDLVDPSQAFTWHLINASFDSTYLGALLTMTGAFRDNDNGLYQITQVLDSHTVVAVPADGRTGQTIYNMSSGETITISKSANAGSPEYQPCWYLTPLSTSQHVAGRWEYGIAYADWRFDGNDKANVSTFERNPYPLALSSVVAGPDGLQLVLPYRAQSFTAGQTITGPSGKVVGAQTAAESTIGLKVFTISPEHGQAVANSDELLLPGLQASEFTASGFTEDGINLGPEKPFVVSQTTEAVVVALSLLAKYQYVAVFEVTDESGERVWSVVSPPLDVVLTGTQNTVTLGGRMPGPTLRVVGVSLYRTAMVGDPQVATTQHYKITNDLDVNGHNFTFSSVNGGPDNDTWQYIDQNADATILSSEVLYTDSGELQHFPAPAFRQGVASWQNRTWVVGYDGAVWPSAEKTEGDAVWFSPAFRFTFPVDDEPVAVAALDSYLVVLFANSAPWVIPAAALPGANGAGALPTPDRLPFPNGCTGFAVTMNAGTPGAGVVYSSTAGGIWMIDRSLRNVYLSQPIQQLLQLGVSGLTVDGQQRLLVATDSTDLYVYDQLPQAWYRWSLPTAAQLVTTRSGLAVYQDSSLVSTYVPGDYTDRVPSPTGIALDVTLALSEFGNVRGLKSVWACDIVGEYRGPHNLNAVMSYPDEPDEPDTTFGPFPADPDEPYIFEINPMVEQTTSYGLRMFVDFDGVATPGNSMALELLSFEVGIEPNKAQVRDAQRITANK